jgi:hypothetical protein
MNLWAELIYIMLKYIIRLQMHVVYLGASYAFNEIGYYLSKKDCKCMVCFILVCSSVPHDICLNSHFVDLLIPNH